LASLMWAGLGMSRGVDLGISRELTDERGESDKAQSCSGMREYRAVATFKPNSAAGSSDVRG
jgi:hypothetical protein